MNRFILADAQKCIGCRTCEVACVVSHQQDQDCSGVSAARFAPRIRVVKNDELSTATLCRQCEDAPCANVCPGRYPPRKFGLARGSAPLHRMQKLHGGVPLWRDDRDAGGGGRTGAEVRFMQPSDEGPACVAACPTQALRCMEPMELERIAAERRQRMALAM
jgi:electron transport protein HydN